jgi:hypothetical protein
VYFRGAVDHDAPSQDFCDESYCYEHVWKAEPRTAGLGYWQVHAYPEVWYYPRDPGDGTPIVHDNLKMDKADAMGRRKGSIDDPLNIEKKAYRNPFLSDSASAIVSFAFVDDGGVALKKRSSISLSGSESGSSVEYEHIPARMYRVIGGDGGLEEALLQLYCEDAEEEEFARTLNGRCVGWKGIDTRNGRYIFPVRDREDGVLKRDWSVKDGDFMYDGCPCTRHAGLGNLTPVQVRRLIYQPLPDCEYYDMKRAWYFFARIAPYMTEKGDRRRLAHNVRWLHKAMSMRREIYAYDGEAGEKRQYIERRRCSPTWVEEPFVRAVIGDVVDVVP